VGKLITYLRRYGLSAMVGVAPEDDDAGEATKEWRKAFAPTPAQPSSPEAAIAEESKHAFPPADQSPPPSFERLAELRRALFDRVYPEDEAAAWADVLAKRGVKSAKELSPKGLGELTAAIEKKIAELDSLEHEGSPADSFRGLAVDGLAAPAA
jgi:hypothetical protein